jgi:hypothetical protein
MKKVLLILFAFASFHADSQSMVGLYFKAYHPSGAFHENVKTTPAGIGMDYFYHPTDSRLMFGAELGLAMYTHFTYNGIIPSGKTIPIYEEDCFWTAHAELRYLFYKTPAIKGYFQGRLGVTTFFSSLQSEDPNVSYFKSQTHGAAFNTGVGAGLMLNTGQIFNGQPGRVQVDLGFGFHNGTSSSYRYVTKDQTIALDQGRYQSLTDYLDFRFGVVLSKPW